MVVEAAVELPTAVGAKEDDEAAGSGDAGGVGDGGGIGDKSRAMHRATAPPLGWHLGRRKPQNEKILRLLGGTISLHVPSHYCDLITSRLFP